MSCEVKLQENSNEQLYTVIIIKPHFFFFTKKIIHKDLTRDKVKDIRIPFLKRIYRMNVPPQVYPTTKF